MTLDLNIDPNHLETKGNALKENIFRLKKDLEKHTAYILQYSLFRSNSIGVVLGKSSYEQS